MQIVEVKNNLVRISYNTEEESLILSGFVAIRDVLQAYIGQIIHLESNQKGNFAIIKLFFNFNNDGVITGYNGSAPDVKSALDIVHPLELLELFPIQTPIVLGELAQQNVQLTLDKNIFEKKLLVCSEKAQNNEMFVKNIARQLQKFGKKILIIDTEGTCTENNKIIAGENFRLPLNYETINFIYEKGLEDAQAETKAMIQEIFLEVQDYVKTLPEQFIPFESFKNVVDSQYEELELVELVLLKNKLLKYYEEGIFAQSREEFDTFALTLAQSQITIFDLSQIDETVQREMISYAYSLLSQLNEEVYVIANITNQNSDKKLLKQIFNTKNAYSTIICSYSYKYLKELKQISKDLILFAPIQQQDDFASYNTFLNKLNTKEFIVYGQSTHHLPLIVKLEETKEQVVEPEQPQNLAQKDAQEELSIDEQIKRDVDTIYTAPKTSEVIYDTEIQEIFEENNFTTDLQNIDEDELELSQELTQDMSENFDTQDDMEKIESNTEEYADYTEEDLDFLDNIGIAEENPEIEEFSAESEEINEAEEIEEIKSGEQETEEASLEEFEETTAPSQSFAAHLEVPEPPEVDILPASMSATPIVPVYSAEIEPQVQSDELEQGDIVTHAKYGKGTVEKLIKYGSKTLCSINFDNVGRRLLDPALAEIKKS